MKVVDLESGERALRIGVFPQFTTDCLEALLTALQSAQGDILQGTFCEVEESKGGSGVIVTKCCPISFLCVARGSKRCPIELAETFGVVSLEADKRTGEPASLFDYFSVYDFLPRRAAIVWVARIVKDEIEKRRKTKVSDGKN